MKSKLLSHLKSKLSNISRSGDYNTSVVLYDFVTDEITTYNQIERANFRMPDIQADYRRLFVSTRQITGNIFSGFIKMIDELENRGLSNTWIVEYRRPAEQVEIQNMYDYVNYGIRYVLNNFIENFMYHKTMQPAVSGGFRLLVHKCEIFDKSLDGKFLCVLSEKKYIDLIKKTGINFEAMLSENTVLFSSEEDCLLAQVSFGKESVSFTVDLFEFRKYLEELCFDRAVLKDTPYASKRKEELLLRYMNYEVKLF